MAYYTAAFTRTDGTWRPREIDLDGAEDLAEVADRARVGVPDDATTVVLLEHEDEWFAVIRVDGEDDPRVFVSDGDGPVHSPFADVLIVEAVPLDEDGAPTGLTALGDPALLDDLGMPSDTLLELCGDDGVLPIEATDAVAAAVGFADLLDTMR